MLRASAEDLMTPAHPRDWAQEATEGKPEKYTGSNPSVLVSARVELTFLLVAATVLRLGFRVRIMLSQRTSTLNPPLVKGLRGRSQTATTVQSS